MVPESDEIDVVMGAGIYPPLLGRMQDDPGKVCHVSQFA